MGNRNSEFRVIELINLYRNLNMSDPALIDAVVKFDPVYVRFRELDALDRTIGGYYGDICVEKDIITTRLPEGFIGLLDLLSEILMAKKDLVMSVDPAELTRCRESLLTITTELEREGIVEFVEGNFIFRYIRDNIARL
jgi:hypothetical protein